MTTPQAIAGNVMYDFDGNLVLSIAHCELHKMNPDFAAAANILKARRDAKANTSHLKTFSTIDLCVDYLTRVLGCDWCYEYEQSLRKNKLFTFAGVNVLWDKYDILA